jgi:hypothetical protein
MRLVRFILLCLHEVLSELFSFIELFSPHASSQLAPQLRAHRWADDGDDDDFTPQVTRQINLINSRDVL